MELLFKLKLIYCKLVKKKEKKNQHKKLFFNATVKKILQESLSLKRSANYI